MSDIGAGIPIGMSIGIGAGIGIGKKGARDEISKSIREFSSTNKITIEDLNGKSVSTEEFITEVIGKHEMNKKLTIVLLVAGTVLLLLGVLVFFLMK